MTIARYVVLNEGLLVLITMLCSYIFRLMALSSHEKEVDVDIWERAKALDRRRKSRAV
jgi:hypothetical protein